MDDEWVLRHNPTYHGRPFEILNQPAGAHPCDLTIVEQIHGNDEDRNRAEEGEGKPPLRSEGKPNTLCSRMQSAALYGRARRGHVVEIL